MRRARKDDDMDLLFLLATAALVALSLLYVRACERI